MKWTTSWAMAASNAPSSKGSASAVASRTSTPGWRARGRGHERLGRIDGGDRVGADASDELGGQGARPAPDIDHAHARADDGEVGHLWRQQDRVATHERVVGVGGDVETHDARIGRTRHPGLA